MTNPIDPTPESTESAAQYRVSAQELSHVVGIVQARKEAEARQRANTVALGDAVEQLGLEMTPDELLAEIHADRARRSGSARPKRQQNVRHRTFATFAVCAGLAGMMVSSIHMHRLNRQMWESRNSPLFLPQDFVVETMPASPAPAQVTIETQSASEMPGVEIPSSADAQFRAFSQFDENDMAACDLDSVRDLANGKSEADVVVRGDGPQEDRLWGLVKQSGAVNVYAFGTATELTKAINGHAAHVYASPHPGMQELLLPLRLFKNAELVDTPGQSGANLNPHSPFADDKPTNWACQAVTETHIKPDADVNEVSPGTKVRMRVRYYADYEDGVVDGPMEVRHR